MFSGGAQAALRSSRLGIMPYISSSIIMQLMTAVSPQWSSSRKRARRDNARSRLQRYGTGVLALFQATGISIAPSRSPGWVIDPGLMLPLQTLS